MVAKADLACCKWERMQLILAELNRTRTGSPE